jgi:hypothetical protein
MPKSKQGFRGNTNKASNQTRRLRRDEKLPDYVSYGNLGSNFIKVKALAHKERDLPLRKKECRGCIFQKVLR